MVAELKKHHTFDVEVIKKTDTAVVTRLFSLTKFPSVEVDGKKIAEMRDVTREELEAALGLQC